MICICGCRMLATGYISGLHGYASYFVGSGGCGEFWGGDCVFDFQTNAPMPVLCVCLCAGHSVFFVGGIL